jgi:hypothetical protein
MLLLPELLPQFDSLLQPKMKISNFKLIEKMKVRGQYHVAPKKEKKGSCETSIL